MRRGSARRAATSNCQRSTTAAPSNDSHSSSAVARHSSQRLPSRLTQSGPPIPRKFLARGPVAGKEFIQLPGMTHVRTRSDHAQSSGKIDPTTASWRCPHGALPRECLAVREQACFAARDQKLMAARKRRAARRRQAASPSACSSEPGCPACRAPGHTKPGNTEHSEEASQGVPRGGNEPPGLRERQQSWRCQPLVSSSTWRA